MWFHHLDESSLRRKSDEGSNCWKSGWVCWPGRWVARPILLQSIGSESSSFLWLSASAFKAAHLDYTETQKCPERTSRFRVPGCFAKFNPAPAPRGDAPASHGEAPAGGAAGHRVSQREPRSAARRHPVLPVLLGAQQWHPEAWWALRAFGGKVRASCVRELPRASSPYRDKGFGPSAARGFNLSVPVREGSLNPSSPPTRWFCSWRVCARGSEWRWVLTVALRVLSEGDFSL